MDFSVEIAISNGTLCNIVLRFNDSRHLQRFSVVISPPVESLTLSHRVSLVSF
jgi:hypothetical protein